MKIRKPSQEDIKLNEQINYVLDSMSTVEPESTQYYKLCNRLSELNELQKSNKPFARVSPDAVIGAAASLGGVGIIVGYERIHALATQSLKLLKIVK